MKKTIFCLIAMCLIGLSNLKSQTVNDVPIKDIDVQYIQMAWGIHNFWGGYVAFFCWVGWMDVQLIGNLFGDNHYFDAANYIPDLDGYLFGWRARLQNDSFQTFYMTECKECLQ